MANELRPTKLSEIIGNENLVECLRHIVNASKIKQKALPHIIFHGMYGCGKSSLAKVLAHEIDGDFIELNAASIKKDSHIIQIIPRITPNCVVYIDEIHRLKTKHEEMFYPGMEDFEFFLPTASHGVVGFEVPQFSLIGATTNLGALSGPFLSRFRHKYSVHLYTEEDLKKMIIINSKKLNLTLSDSAAEEIAKRCKNVPRYANNLLSWVNDYCISSNKTNVGIDDVDKALRMDYIDEHGFDRQDREYLDAIRKHQPIGLTNLAAAIGSTPETIVKYIEPIMLARGIVEVRKEGRILKGFRLSEEKRREISESLSYLHEEVDVETLDI